MKDMLEAIKLSDDEVLIVGINTSVSSKSGQIGTSVSYLANYGTWQKERAVRNVGLNAVTEFAREMDCSELEAGDVVRLIYRKGFDGKASLAGYTKV